VIDDVVSPVDQSNPVPVDVSTELPQPSTADTVGADGVEIGFADTVVGELVQPPTVWVTV
jgi:hypothetical protein